MIKICLGYDGFKCYEDISHRHKKTLRCCHCSSRRAADKSYEYQRKHREKGIPPKPRKVIDHSGYL